MTRLLVGGTDQVQLPADSTGKRAGFVKTAIGGAGTEIYVPASVLTDDAGNTLDSANSTLAIAGTERGLVVRNAGIVNTRPLRDAGRNTRVFALDAYTAAPVAEAVVSVVQWYGNAAVATTVSPAVVPAGKTLRLTGYKIMYQSIATAGYAVIRIRCNTAGTGVLGSPLVASFEAGAIAAVAGLVQTETGDFPDGLEIPAAAGLAFSMAGYGSTGTLTLMGGVRFQVFGFEY